MPRAGIASSKTGRHHEPAQKADPGQDPRSSVPFLKPRAVEGPQHLLPGFSEPTSSIHTSFSAGASGVGRSHIKNALLSNNPEKFMYPPPCKYPARVEGTTKGAFPLTSLSQDLLTAVVVERCFLPPSP